MENTIQKIIDYIWPWFLTHGIKIVLIFAVAFTARRISGFFLEKFIRRVIKPDHFLSRESEKKREDTLIRICSGVLGVFIWIVAVIMVVSEFGVNIGPLIAGAGIIGAAIGFGAQNLIRDTLSGLFVILENQYRVGDVVCFDKTCGLVEDITLRLTILRDLDGTVHHISNGQAKMVSNLTKNFSRVNLDVGVAYNSDLEKVIEVINRVGRELTEDSVWKEHIIKAPQFLRVEDFADSAIIVKILGETKPIKQWDVTGELRKRLKIAFDKEGIEIPFPQRVIHQAKD